MKKGFMYTFFAIAMVASLAFLVSLQTAHIGTSKLAEKIKSDEVFYFMRGADSDLIRAGEIAGRRAILTGTDAEILNGYFFAEPNNTIQQLMLNGTFNNTEMFLMENSTLDEWETTMDSIGKQRDINADVNITSLKVGEGGAFYINATINGSI